MSDAIKMVLTMDLVKETKGTHVYAGEADIIPTLYIRKGAFSGAAPKTIEVTVKETEVE